MKLYAFIVSLPERWYPFSCYIDGERVRWQRSYEYRLAQIQDTLGVGRYGVRLATYREVWHVIGAGLIILAATFLSHMLWGSDVALPVMFIVAMGVITYQEFILQPRTYNQRIGKGIADWVCWAAPLSAYLFLIAK